MNRRVVVIGSSLANARDFGSTHLVGYTEIIPVSVHRPDGARGLTAELILVTPEAMVDTRLPRAMEMCVPCVMAGAHSGA